MAASHNKYVTKYYETTHLIKKDKPEMNVMLFSSQEQFDYIYTMIYSMMENNPDVIIHLFIVSFQELVGAEMLAEFLESRGNRITYYVLDSDYVLPLKKRKIRTRTGLGGLIRPIAHTIIEEEYDRVLFMDADMLVLGEIYSEFYNLDFDDKYLIVPANTAKDADTLEKEMIDFEKCVKGSYFNSAILVFNLTKLRNDISYEKVLEAANRDERIENEQHILNVLLAAKARYVNPEIYHCRWMPTCYKDMDITEENIKKMRIYHYDPPYVAFKPWDVWFENEEDLNRIVAYPFKPITSKYRTFVMHPFVNDMMGLWWEYTKSTPVYDKLYNRMVSVRTYFNTYVSNIINVYNRNMNALERLSNNIITDETSSISEIKKQKNLTWLNAINEYYGISKYDYSETSIDYKAKDLNTYFKSFAGDKDLVVFITANMTAHFISDKLKEKEKYGLKFDVKLNDSYYAILDFSKDMVIEESGNGFLVKRYFIETADCDPLTIKVKGIHAEIRRDTTIPVLLKSEGYNPKTSNSYNSILINNIEYAQGIRGISIVVFSKSRNMVVDKCFVDNGRLDIKR